VLPINWQRSERDDSMPTVFKEVQDSKDLVDSQNEVPGQVGSSPDIVLEHGTTRLSLDLDGWEWFWLFLAIFAITIVWFISKS
jgi:hypothetical protein